MSYKAYCGWDGEEKYFREKKEAKRWRNRKISEVHHQRVCIDKDMGTPRCLCTISNGERECSMHTYWRTMEPNSATECRHTETIYVEEIDVC